MALLLEALGVAAIAAPLIYVLVRIWRSEVTRGPARDDVG